MPYIYNPLTDELDYYESGGGGSVDSVFGRTGTVAAQNNDYDASQIKNTPAGNILSTNIQDATNELDVKKQTLLRGFDRLNPDKMGVPSYNESLRQFSLSVKSGESYFEFWAGGKRFTKTTTQSKVIPDVHGVYYFYFDTNGDLQYVLKNSLTTIIFLTSAICGLCSWNSDTNKMIVQAQDEQHATSSIMSPAAHFNLHLTRGFKWAHGGEIIGLADASDVYTNITSGLNLDEDIPIVTPEITNTPFIYRDGASGGWVETTPDLKIGYIASGDTYISFNEEVLGVWQLTESSLATDYIIYFMIKTNDKNHPYKKIVGQNAYPNKSSARAALAGRLKEINLQNLPSTEIEFQFAWIARRNGTLEDDGNGNAYVDLRGVPIHAAPS